MTRTSAGRRRQVAEQGREQLVARGAGADSAPQLAAELAGDVEQRASGRGVNRPSQAPQAQRASGSSLELLEQRGLADAGLTRDEDQPALPAPCLPAYSVRASSWDSRSSRRIGGLSAPCQGSSMSRLD